MKKSFIKIEKEIKKMKKRLHDKKAGIAILISLIIISLADIIFRAVVDEEMLFTVVNVGEQVTVIVLSLFIMLMSIRGKDRVCYILYGAWASYFVFDQLFELPGIIADTVNLMSLSGWALTIGNIAFISRVLSMITIVTIGILLVEYMNDGTIYNRAFNALSIVTVLLIAVNILISVYTVIAGLRNFEMLIQAINNLSRITMVFMFAFFAYDSAKMQLKKTDLTK
jgi:hypothetical protein